MNTGFVQRLKEFASNRDNLASLVVGTVGCLAIVAALTLKGYTLENVLDAIKDIAGLGAVFVAIGFVVRSAGPHSFSDAGERALKQLQLAFPKHLTGPRYSPRGQKKKAAAAENKDDTEEQNGDTARYLFFKHENDKYLVKLIPLKPLADGEIQIAISGTTLWALDFENDEDRLHRCAQEVAKAVAAKLDRLPGKKCIEFSATTVGKKEKRPNNSAIIIQVGNEMSYGCFEKVLFGAGKTAVETLLAFKKTESGRTL